jgi:hypothetical protein
MACCLGKVLREQKGALASVLIAAERLGVVSVGVVEVGVRFVFARLVVGRDPRREDLQRGLREALAETREHPGARGGVRGCR